MPLKNQKYFSLAAFLYLILTSPCTVATPNQHKLVKVTSDVNSKCVEYYDYRGEMYCSTKPLNTKPIDPTIRNSETQTIVFDDRAWQAVWGKNSADGTTLEYVPMGDNIDDWHELVTSQFFPMQTDNVTPKEFAEQIIKGLQHSGYQPTVTFIENSTDSLIFEFRIESPSEQAQDELQKITKTKKGIYVLHYVIKVPDMGQENREKWVSNLSKSTVK